MNEWPRWARDRKWSVHVMCERVINRRDVAPGTVGTHREYVIDSFQGVRLSDAVHLAEDQAREHEAKNRDRPYPHTVIGISVRWECRCKYDKQIIAGWDQPGMADALVDHLMAENHTTAMRKWRAESESLEGFMDALGLFIQT